MGMGTGAGAAENIDIPFLFLLMSAQKINYHNKKNEPTLQTRGNMKMKMSDVYLSLCQ